jgi:virginiamycin B lyase
MRKFRLSLLATAATASMLVFAAPGFAEGLSGQISSTEEGAMEGVLVSAKKDGATMTVTVASDDKGRYSFPADRLTPGHYTLKIRAVGFDLDGPKSVDIPSGQAASADIKLKRAGNISGQLTNSEWLLSLPGTDGQKKFLYGCTSCHTLERIVKSTHTKDEFLSETLVKMAGYSSQAFPLKPQRRLVSRDLTRAFSPQVASLAEYLASVNLSEVSQWEYQLKTLPRPTGKATRMIVTEYDLPRQTIQPHDVVLDQEGTVWFTNFGENDLGKMDARTGKVTEYEIPMLRPGYATGNLDIEFDREGNIWLGLMNQTGAAKFDKKTGEFTFVRVPESMLNPSSQQAMVAAVNWEADGKIWVNDAETVQVARIDVATGQMEPWIQPYKTLGLAPEGHSLYGIYTDKQNNLFFMDFSNRNIGRIDAKTGDIKLFPTPTDRSRPRRGQMDSQDRLWFAEWFADQVGMFDTKTGTFKEWKVPTPYAAPYYAMADEKERIWAAGMNDDRVTRVDTKTGETIEYLLPRETNTRRVFVDKSGAFWTGSNHGASIVKLEALD